VILDNEILDSVATSCKAAEDEDSLYENFGMFLVFITLFCLESDQIWLRLDALAEVCAV